jgi:hypothetical protein
MQEMQISGEAYEAAENPVLRDQKPMDRLHDPGRIVVSRQSAMYSNLLHEGEFGEGKA